MKYLIAIFLITSSHPAFASPQDIVMDHVKRLATDHDQFLVYLLQVPTVYTAKDRHVKKCLQKGLKLHQKLSLKLEKGSLEITACWPTPVKGP